MYQKRKPLDDKVVNSALGLGNQLSRNRNRVLVAINEGKAAVTRKPVVYNEDDDTYGRKDNAPLMGVYQRAALRKISGK